MTPKEIAQLKGQSPALRMALGLPDVYTFLRERVLVRIHWTDEHLVPTQGLLIRAVTVVPHQVPCGRCQRAIAYNMTLASPYNSSYRPHDCAYIMPHGWCVDCVLASFFADAPLYDEHADPESPTYDAVYARNKQVWEHFHDAPDDYDGPPIAIA